MRILVYGIMGGLLRLTGPAAYICFLNAGITHHQELDTGV